MVCEKMRGKEIEERKRKVLSPTKKAPPLLPTAYIYMVIYLFFLILRSESDGKLSSTSSKEKMIKTNREKGRKNCRLLRERERQIDCKRSNETRVTDGGKVKNRRKKERNAN